MAEYKAVNAEQLDSDLKSVADSIRSKGGTSGSLTFPEGFKTAVANIKTGNDAKEEQDKTLEITENGEHKIFPDEGKVLSSATAKVNVPERYNEGYNEGFAEGKDQGLSEGYSNGFGAGVNSVKLQEKTVTENGDVLPDEGFNGMSKVIVAVPVKEEQEKSITITENGTTEVIPDEGKTLSKVTVETNVVAGGEVGKPYIDTSKITNFAYFCHEDARLEVLDGIDTSNGTNFSYMFSRITKYTIIPQLNTSNGTNFSYMFYNSTGYSSVPQLDTSNGTDFTCMFSSCGVKEIPQLNTSKGTNFSYMFRSNDEIKSVPQLDTSNGTDFTCMFGGCVSLTSVPQFNTSSGTKFNSMFGDCRSLVTVPQFDTSKGTSLESMFNGCKSLTSVQLLNIDTSTVASGKFSSIFRGCTSLVSVSLGTTCTDFYSNSFMNCTALTNLTIGEGWGASIYLTYSNNLSVESLHGMIENLADLTGQKAKTFQVGATNLAKIDEEHIAMLNAKNWVYS